MSKRDPSAPLRDMREYALMAMRVAGGLNAEQIRASEIARLALERALEVIGEAANRVPKERREQLAGIPWSAIIGLRNILAHAYDDVRDEILVTIVSDNLPDLIEQLDRALGPKVDRRK